MAPLWHTLRRGLHKYGNTMTGVSGPVPASGLATSGRQPSLSPASGAGASLAQPATMAPSLGNNSGPQLGSTPSPAGATGQPAPGSAFTMGADISTSAPTGYGAQSGFAPTPPQQATPAPSGPPQTPADALPTTAGPAGAPPSPAASNTGSILPDNFAASVGADQPLPGTQPTPAQISEQAGAAGAQMEQQQLNQAIDQEQATNPTGGPTQPELDQAQLTERLNDQSRPLPERQQDARAYVQSLVDSDPELKQGLNDLAGGKDTPQARAFQSRIDGAGNNFVSQEFQRLMAERQAQTGAPPTTQEQGGFFQQAMDGWNNMSMPMKMMMGLGLGAGIIGIMSSLFGEGGGGMGLLGLLGLGVAGVGGAMGGMFGEGAQSGVNNMLLSAGEALGVVPGKQDLSALMAADPVAAAASQGGGMLGALAGGTGAVREQLAKAEKQRGQLQQLSSLPTSLRNALLMRMDPANIKSPADAERAFANSQQIVGAFDDPNSAIGKRLADGRAYVDGGNSVYGAIGATRDAFGQAVSDPIGYAQSVGRQTWDAGANAAAGLSDWWNGGQEKQNAFRQNEHIVRYLVAQWAEPARTKLAFNAMDAKELHDLQALQARTQKYDLKNTRRLHELQKRKMSQPPSGPREKIIVLCQKAARCWAGYEPVPGKAPYTEDSCRPAGSKKKTPAKKKPAK